MKQPRTIPRFLLLGVLVFAAAPGLAVADMGTALMWASFLHLFVGNALIGVVEGVILARIFKVRKGPAIWIMIAANYFSAWVGAYLVAVVAYLASPNLYTAWWWLWLLLFLTLPVTMILEWPFVALALRKSSGWFRKSLKASVILQSITYAALFVWYWLASPVSLYTQLTTVPPSQIDPPDSAVLYYIGASDGNVYRLDGLRGEPERIAQLNSKNNEDRLFVRESPQKPGSWDLVARLQGEDWRSTRTVTIEEALTAFAVPIWKPGYSGQERVENSWFNFGRVPILGSAQSGWKFRCGFWPAEGMTGTHEGDARDLHFAMETPFIQWPIRNAVQLPGDLVVFQLGEDQICILDPNTRKVALLARGRGPVVILTGDEPTSEPLRRSDQRDS